MKSNLSENKPKLRKKIRHKLSMILRIIMNINYKLLKSMLIIQTLYREKLDCDLGNIIYYIYSFEKIK